MLFGAAVVPMAMNGDTTVVAAKRVDINVPDEHGPKTVECMKSTFVICAEKGVGGMGGNLLNRLHCPDVICSVPANTMRPKYQA